MKITDAAVLRMAGAPPEVRSDMLMQTDNYKGIISKAKDLQVKAPVDGDMNDKMDLLIGECSFYEMKQRLGDAFIMLQ
jgi:hypothetical protein